MCSPRVELCMHGIKRCSAGEARAASREPRAASNEERGTRNEERATSHEERATSCELRATSYEERATICEPRATSYEERATSCEPRATLVPGFSRGESRRCAVVSRSARQACAGLRRLAQCAATARAATPKSRARRGLLRRSGGVQGRCGSSKVVRGRGRADAGWWRENRAR